MKNIYEVCLNNNVQQALMESEQFNKLTMKNTGRIRSLVKILS